jgi:predicted transcriptional regulator of viral defense system
MKPKKTVAGFPRLPSREVLSRLARGARGGLISVGRAAALLDMPTRAAANKIAALERRGWLARVRRGLYLVRPLEASTNVPSTVEDPWLLAQELFSPCYIGGWSAAEHWGLTEQLFRSTFVVTAVRIRRSTEQLLAAELHLVHVSPEAVKGAVTIWRGNERVAVSDRERTIADALVSPDWVGGVRHLFGILAAYRESREWNPEKLLQRLEERGRGSAFKRLGYLAEALWPDIREVVDTARRRRTSGLIKLDPSVKTRGRINKRWGLWVNVSLEKRDLHQ